MKTRILLAVVLSLLCVTPTWLPSSASARGSGSSDSSEENSSNYHASKRRSHAKHDADVQRDARGRIKRSATAKNRFRKENPCPSTGESRGACPGYVIDHVVPLKRGGKDSPENIQWQTEEEAKAKNKLGYTLKREAWQ